MKISTTPIPDLVLVEPEVFGDSRGYFMETWHRHKYQDAGINDEFVQDNHSRSVRGTLRGLHYQIKQPQGKLIRVTLGEVFDVAVDLRRSSASFGQWFGTMLSEENKQQLWVPPGFAHGFFVLSEFADFQYKCTDYYSPQFENCIRWDDPSIGIDWPIPNGFEPILSEKDLAGSELSCAPVYE